MNLLDKIKKDLQTLFISNLEYSMVFLTNIYMIII